MLQDLAFDKKFGMLEKGQLDKLVLYIMESATNQVVRGFFPWVNKLIVRWGTQPWREWAQASGRLFDYAVNLYEEWKGLPAIDRHTKL